MNKGIRSERDEGKSGLAVRMAARDLLMAVLDRQRPLDEQLALAFAAGGPLARAEARDRAFLKLLVNTTLRRLGQIDQVLKALIERPLPPNARWERAVLRLAAAQLLFLGTPAHAAVDGAVASLSPKSHYRGLVNATLRRVGRDAASLLDGQDAARLNTPDWLWASWSKAYGEAAARAIAEAHLGEPPLDLSVREDAAGWAARLNGRLLPNGSVRITAGGPLETLPGFAEGAWWVQDVAAALPVRLLPLAAGSRVFDLCAAPGGKTMELAAAGAQVTAVERNGGRLRRLAENLARVGLSAELVEADAAVWQPDAAAPLVLLDAPCSSTGTIRRHPDIAWTKKRDDVLKLAAAQDRLLAAAAGLVAPGGSLVYCVCSLEPEEGPERVAKFLATGVGRDFHRAPLPAAIAAMLPEAITEDGDLRTLPSFWVDQGGMDGFYAALLQRR